MRELFIVRHAIAYERDASRWPDDDKRPLTREGKQRFRKAARGIRRSLPQPDEVLSSPLVRAHQTARILERTANYPRADLLRELEPNIKTQQLLTALRKRTARRVAIVGHEPALSKLLCQLLQGDSPAAYALKKGSVVWIDFANGRPQLLAYLPPRVLRRAA